MKIIYIYNIFDQKGGIERVLTDKMNYLADVMNYEVTLVTYMQGKNPFPFPLDKKVKHIDIGYNLSVTYKFNFLKQEILSKKINSQYKKNLIDIIKEKDADVIICNSYDIKGIEVISQLNVRAIKIIETHVARNFIKYPIYRNVPFLLLQIITFYQNIKLNLAIKKFDAIVTLTKEDAELWKKTVPTYTIPNIVTYYPSQNSPCINNKVIAVGRISEQKGFDLLIEAWKEINKKHPNWTLDIYGDDKTGKDLKECLIHSIKKLHLDNCIKFNLAIDNIFDKYLESSIFVLSSRFEGFGLVLIEAMACGLPSVAFDCPFGPKEIISNGENGILVKYLDIEELAEKINYLIENESIRIKMGEMAREDVKYYLKDNIMPKWVDLFKELILKKQQKSKK